MLSYAGRMFTRALNTVSNDHLAVGQCFLRTLVIAAHGVGLGRKLGHKLRHATPVSNEHCVQRTLDVRTVFFCHPNLSGL